MAATMTIELKKLQFFSYHGLYPEERITGNEYEVDLAVSIFTGDVVITNLDSTVNYEKLYELAKEEMKHSRDLLETLAMELSQKIYSSFTSVKRIEIKIKKLHPPISGFTGSVAVNFSKEF